MPTIIFTLEVRSLTFKEQTHGGSRRLRVDSKTFLSLLPWSRQSPSSSSSSSVRSQRFFLFFFVADFLSQFHFTVCWPHSVANKPVPVGNISSPRRWTGFLFRWKGRFCEQARRGQRRRRRRRKSKKKKKTGTWRRKKVEVTMEVPGIQVSGKVDAVLEFWLIWGLNLEQTEAVQQQGRRIVQLKATSDEFLCYLNTKPPQKPPHPVKERFAHKHGPFKTL